MPTCLVVDDSRVIRKVAVKMLNELNFKTREAENGAVGLAACRDAMPDVVLLDWNMPVLDGMSFLKQLRQMPEPLPKVLFCTTETDFARIAEAMAAGADEYIMKPFDNDILESKLRLLGML